MRKLPICDIQTAGVEEGSISEWSRCGCCVACTGLLFFLHGVGILPSPRF